MFISLSILPIYLILCHGVISDDLSADKRVPRRHTQVSRTYHSNHPPIIETVDKIPVTVVYDNEEVIKERNETEKKKDGAVEDENLYLKHANSGVNPINIEGPSVSHPPSPDLHPVDGVNVYEQELNLNPRARSIKIPVSDFDETKAHEKPPTESDRARTGIKPRKRVQKVRKVKVDRTKPNVTENESVMFENKVAHREPTTTTHKPSLHDPQTFKPRKGVRDPVVPIIESESYVFSHSGNFHYSYEGGDGTKAYERGELKSSEGGSGSAVEGNFSYKDKDGNDVSLSYTADENGYRPVGAHLPTPPPIPPAIQRALAHLATKTTPEPVTERMKTL